MNIKNKAWPASLWIELQKNIVKPNIKDGLYELNFLFNAVLKKKTNNIVIGKHGEGYWTNIDDKDLTSWKLTMSFWGWGGKTVILLNKEVEDLMLRNSIRLFSSNPDGAIPKVMTYGAQKRKKWLHKQLKIRQNHPHWVKINMLKSDEKERYDALSKLSLEERSRLGVDLKQWYSVYNELAWKEKAAQRIQEWLLLKRKIPLSVTNKWLEIWLSSLDTQK